MENIRRILTINCRIRRKGFVTMDEIRREFGISVRQFRRDIAGMRDTLHAPIEYDTARRGYVYTTPFDHLDCADKKAVLFYILVERISRDQRLLPFASDEILSKLKSVIPADSLPLLSAVSYETEELENLPLRILETVTDAILRKRAVSFLYKDSKGRESVRDAEPLHLICYSGRWYCAAYDCGKQALRKFHLARMKEFRIADGRPVCDISVKELKDYLTQEFGIYKTGKLLKAVVRFYEPVYHIVRDQVWHKNERKTEGTHPEYGKYVEVTVPVGDYEEITGKILRYGPYAEAVEPEEFRERWLGSLREASVRFLK